VKQANSLAAAIKGTLSSSATSSDTWILTSARILAKIASTIIAASTTGSLLAHLSGGNFDLQVSLIDLQYCHILIGLLRPTASRSTFATSARITTAITALAALTRVAFTGGSLWHCFLNWSWLRTATSSLLGGLFGLLRAAADLIAALAACARIASAITTLAALTRVALTSQGLHLLWLRATIAIGSTVAASARVARAIITVAALTRVALTCNSLVF